MQTFEQKSFFFALILFIYIISMIISALFSVPQQHYLSFTLSSCRAQLLKVDILQLQPKPIDYNYVPFSLLYKLLLFCSVCTLLGRWSRDGPVLIFTFTLCIPFPLVLFCHSEKRTPPLLLLKRCK